MLDRSIAPPAADIDRPNLPTLEVVNITDKLSINILRQGSQPVILFEMVVPVGRFEEPAPGVSYYLFKMLTEGTLKRNSEEIASIFDFYGSHLEIIPTLDNVSIKLYSLSKFFPKLLQLLTEMITESNFSEKEFDTLKMIRTQNIRQQNAKNNVFAGLKFREMLFGESHPYGRIVTEKQAKATSIGDLNRFRDALLVRPALFMTGDVTDAEIKAVNDCLSQINYHNGGAKHSFPLNSSSSSRITKEGSTQASLRIGGLMINRHHKDIHKLKVTNELLGGFFGSRLMKNIREDKGLTYGIHSGLMHLQHASYWHIGSEMLNEKLELGITEIHKEIRTIQSQAPKRAEFEMVVNYMKGKFLSSFDSPFSAHDMMKSMWLEGLTEQYFFDFFDTLQHITPEELSETATKYFKAEELLELVVY